MTKKRRPNGRRLLADWLKTTTESKTETAEGLGMSVEQLRHIETGRRTPTLPQAIVLEDKLLIPIRSWP